MRAKILAAASLLPPHAETVQFDALGRIRAPFTLEPRQMPDLKDTLHALVKSVGWEEVLDALSRVAWDEPEPRPYGDRLAERIDDALAVVER